VDIEVEAHQVARTNSERVISALQTVKQNFLKSVHAYPEYPCEFCRSLQYFPSTRRTKISQAALTQIQNLCTHSLPFTIGDEVRLCKRCHVNVPKGKFSAQVFFNKMESPEVPQEIKDLSNVEAQMLSQVRPFMKIYNLSKGRGQYAVMGGTTHFPNSVQDVCAQLPLSAKEAGIVVVQESTENIGQCRELQVRPSILHAALAWLKEYNLVYRGILSSKLDREEVNDNFDMDYLKTNAVESTVVSSCVNHYKLISGNRMILRANFHQASPVFPSDRAGKQCTAIAITSIAYASVQSPSTWDSEVLSKILIHGDLYFSQKSPSGQELMAIEAAGILNNVFEGPSIELKCHENESTYGGLNKLISTIPRPLNFNDLELSTATQLISNFIVSQHYAAILTVGGYSVSLLKNEGSIYYFDSHSRGPNGAISNDGVACVIKFEINNAPHQISLLLHISYQSKSDILNENSRAEHIISLVPVSCHHVEQRSTASVEFEGHESGQSESSNHKTNLDPPCGVEFGERIESDSVLHAIDNNAPDVVEIIDQNGPMVNLVWRKGRPVYPNTQRRLEGLSFVKLFPFGVGGLDDERPIPITTHDYFQARILSSDTQFWDTSYLFYALNRVEEDQIRKKIAICANMKTAQDVEGNDEHFPGLSNVHTYMSSIRGSASYWKQYAGDLIAMIKQLGLPTFFITFSSDDLNSSDSLAGLLLAQSLRGTSDPSLVQSVREGIRDENYCRLQDIVSNLSYEKRSELLNNHPVSASLHFNRRCQEIVKMMCKNGELLFGYPVLDWSYRVEFQNRGSAHMHMLLWLEVKDLDYKSTAGDEFINRNICCSIPSDDDELKSLVLQKQNHRHRGTCFKSGKSYCRFGFPRPVSSTSTVLDEEDISKNHGRFLQLKRNESETMINDYHPDLLRIVKSNMDIQLVTGAMGIAYYIAKYISKAEPTNIRKEIQDIIKRMQTDKNKSCMKQALLIAKTIMNKREVGAPEAAFRLCHLSLRKSSRGTVFIPTWKPEKRIRIVFKESLGEENVKFGMNIIERYSFRPSDLRFLSLFEFAAHYRPIAKDDDDDFDEGMIVDEEVEEPIIRLKDQNGRCKGRMTKRKIPAIVKYPNLDPIENKAEYYYSLILLYLPFCEENFMEGYQSESEAFQCLQASFRTHQHDAIIRLDLVKEFDRANLRIATFLTPVDDQGQCPDEEIRYDEDFADFSPQEVFHVNEIVLDIQRRVESFSEEQKQVFQDVRTCLNTPNSPQFFGHVAGAGGVGKSYLIECLSSLITNSLSYDNVLIRAAPTGLAALNIKGTTLHRAFSLPIEKFGSANYLALGSRKLQEMRNGLRNLQWIIIDEISMVSYQTLRFINLRLGEIFNSEDPFGGINVILLGDILQVN
jgi:hypothetical protein